MKIIEKEVLKAVTIHLSGEEIMILCWAMGGFTPDHYKHRGKEFRNLVRQMRERFGELV